MRIPEGDDKNQTGPGGGGRGVGDEDEKTNKDEQ
jgi:hypothetical protein